jgi:hypothetical protein
MPPRKPKKLKYLKLPERAEYGFAMHLAQHLPGAVIENPNFLTSVREELSDLDQLASKEVYTSRAEALNLPIDASELRDRVLFNQDNRIILAGVRYKSLNRDFPFIELNMNFDLTTSNRGDIEILVAKEFQKIAPLGFTVKQAPDSMVDTEAWNHVVFGKTRLKNASVAESHLEFDWPKTFGDYSTYRSEYERLLHLNKNLQGIVRVETEDVLKRSAGKGLLMAVQDQFGLSALIAGQQRDLYGLPCLYMMENLITERWRGKGLSSWLQSVYLTSLRDRYEYVYGHISSKNVASLKAAFACGREIIQTEYYCEL